MITKTDMRKPVIAVIGLGFVGLTLAIVNSYHGFKTIGIDINQKKIEQLNNGSSYFYEPKLDQLLKKAIHKDKIIFSSNLNLISESDIIFITVGTPPKSNGQIDLNFLKNAINNIGKIINKDSKNRTIVIKSTVVPTTLKHIYSKFRNSKTKIVVNPEFLREGNAINDLENPHIIVIGEEKKNSSKELISYYNKFYQKTPEIILTNFTTAELIKYSNNAFLATKISFINSIASICQNLPNTDVDTIAYAIGKDSRIGSEFLSAGPGFGGSCLPKDLSALINFSDSMGKSNLMFKAVKNVNHDQIDRIFELMKKMKILKKSSKIGILGVAFKKETDDIRESVAIEIVNKLLKKGLEIHVHDPMALQNFKELFVDKIKYFKSAHECISNTDCCLVLTEWPEYKKLKEKDFLKMKQPNVIDSRRILESKMFKKISYKAIGLGI